LSRSAGAWPAPALKKIRVARARRRIPAPAFRRVRLKTCVRSARIPGTALIYSREIEAVKNAIAVRRDLEVFRNFLPGDSRTSDGRLPRHVARRQAAATACRPGSVLRCRHRTIRTTRDVGNHLAADDHRTGRLVAQLIVHRVRSLFVASPGTKLARSACTPNRAGTTVIGIDVREVQ
jgi:hypothetical protein